MNQIFALFCLLLFQLHYQQANASSGKNITTEPRKIKPEAYPDTNSMVPYTVVSGDTCYLISYRFSISVEELYADNPVIDPQCYNLYPQQVLKLRPTKVTLDYLNQISTTTKSTAQLTTSATITKTSTRFVSTSYRPVPVLSDDPGTDELEVVTAVPLTQTRKPQQDSLDLPGYRYVCYYPNWSQLQPERIDPFLCTHIVFTYLTIESLKVSTGNTFDEPLMRRLATLREKNPNIKLLIGIGGKLKVIII
jgi:LysM repeat protein